MIFDHVLSANSRDRSSALRLWNCPTSTHLLCSLLIQQRLWGDRQLHTEPGRPLNQLVYETVESVPDLKEIHSAENPTLILSMDGGRPPNGNGFPGFNKPSALATGKAVQSSVDIDGHELPPSPAPVSYTHLTLPTKRIV